MQEGEQYAKENDLLFYETSAKTAQNVNEFFYEIGKVYYFLSELKPSRQCSELHWLGSGLSSSRSPKKNTSTFYELILDMIL